MPAPVILALNMVDVAEQEEFASNRRCCKPRWGFVVPMSAAHGKGLTELRRRIAQQVVHNPAQPTIS